MRESSLPPLEAITSFAEPSIGNYTLQGETWEVYNNGRGDESGLKWRVDADTEVGTADDAILALVGKASL